MNIEKVLSMLLDYIQIDNKLHISYFNKSGKTEYTTLNLKKDDLFNWKRCTINNSNIDNKYKTWDNKPVIKKYITNNKEKLSPFRIGEIIDDLEIKNKDLYNKIFEYSIPRTFFVDIETNIDPSLSVKESAEHANMPITLIGIATPERQVLVLSANKNTKLSKREILDIDFDVKEHTKTFCKSGKEFEFKLKQFDNEVDMLIAFLSMVKKIPVMSGWNFVDFDWKYIVNRCKRLHIDIKQSSPIGVVYGKESFPAHVAIIDYMQCYNKWDTSISKENLKLDQAGLDVLGVQKVQYNGSLDDLYKNDFKKYIYYNAIDCALVEMLHEKLQVSSIGHTLAHIAKCPTMKMFSPVVLTESILARNYYKEKLVLPIKQNVKSNNESYSGAYVKQPIVGFHKCCICNDFASLYPNIIRELNISPETLFKKIDENDTELKNKYIKQGFIVSDSGCVFTKKQGVFSKLVGDVYNKRKHDKKIAVSAAIKARLLEDLLKSNITDVDILEEKFKKILE